MSLAQSYNVHLGFWTNWSHGKIEGATVTLNKREGGLLIAFIAIFVGAAGKSFWRVVCFLLHRMISSSTPEDGVYHQTQAILRNSDTAQGAAWNLGQIVWAWKVPARFRRPFPRLFGIIVLAIFVSVSFGVAGVFSSQITTDTANEVLLKGDNCGPLDSNDDDDYVGYANLFEPFQNKRVATYSEYALRCYNTNVSTDAEDCQPYIRPSLKTTVSRNATCPFSKEMCKSQTDNLIVDSGLLDSHADLGINSAPENRFQLRLLHHCAPVVTQGFSAPFKGNDTGEEVVRYYYGNISHSDANYTQEMPALTNVSSIASPDRPGRSRPRADHTVNVVKAYGGPPEIQKFSLFQPIQQLYRRDADVMLFFLSSPGIAFAQPVDDPVFSAHRPGPELHTVVKEDNRRKSYLQDEPVGVIGCTMQTQFCNPNLPESSRCAPLSGYADDTFPVTSLYETASQKKMFRWAIDVFQLGFFSISGIVDALGVSALVARQGLANNLQGPLPDNQWQIEVEHWVAASLTSIQGSFVETGNGPSAPYERFRRHPNGTDEEHMCRSQKIMTNKYSSFSVLGVGLILVLGGVFMLLDFALEPLVNHVHARRSRKRPNPTGTYARLEWDANTTLNLQRLAHEHIGVGQWSHARWGHPVTARGDKLAMIDVSDARHVLLISPDVWAEKGLDDPDVHSRRWDEETLKRAEVASADAAHGGVRRSATFESIDSLVMNDVKRADTAATLVTEMTDDAHGSPKLEE